MKNPKKETFYERNFSHILVIGLAMSITLLVMVTYVLPKFNVLRGGVIINTQSVNASSPFEPVQEEENKYYDNRW